MNKNDKSLRVIMNFNIVMLILLLFIFITIFFTIAMSLDYFSVSPTGQGIEFPCFNSDISMRYDYATNMDMDGNILSVQGEEVIDFSRYNDGNELAFAISTYYEGIGCKCGTLNE